MKKTLGISEAKEKSVFRLPYRKHLIACGLGHAHMRISSFIDSYYSIVSRLVANVHMHKDHPVIKELACKWECMTRHFP